MNNIVEQFTSSVEEVFTPESSEQIESNLFTKPTCDNATCDNDKSLERICKPIQCFDSILVHFDSRDNSDLILLERRFSEKSKRVAAGSNCAAFVRYRINGKTTNFDIAKKIASLAANSGFRAVNYHHLVTTRKRKVDSLYEAYEKISPYNTYLVNEDLRTVDQITQEAVNGVFTLLMSK